MKWRTTKQAGIPCPACGKAGRCTTSPDRARFKCWKKGGALFTATGEPVVSAAERAPSPALRSTPNRKRKPTTRVSRTVHEAIQAALRTVKAPDQISQRIGGQWVYTKGGREIMRVVRIDLSDSQKEFRPLHKAEDGWRLGDPSGSLPLFLLDEVQQSTDVVWVCEGEKAAIAANNLGLIATTSAHGSSAAAKSDWSVLAGRHVVIFPDNDEPGRKYARDVLSILTQLTPPATVKVVSPPGLPDGGDIVEFISMFKERSPQSDTRQMREALEALADGASTIEEDELAGSPVLTSLADVTPKEVDWLWPQRIPLGKLSLIIGDPGVGKTFLTHWVAAQVSNGNSWPDDTRGHKGHTILISGEDGIQDTIAPRLIAANANRAMISILEGIRSEGAVDNREMHRAFNLRDVPALENALRRKKDCKLIVIDPVSAYMVDADSHNNSEVRGILAPLAKLAEKYGVAIVLVTHMSKGNDARALYRAMGSIAFVAAVRSAQIVVRDPAKRDRRLFLPLKSNLGSPKGGLAYEILDGKVQWDPAPVLVNADDVLAHAQGAPRRPGPEPTSRSRAEELLRDLLSGGPRRALEVESIAENEYGLSAGGALRRARELLGVKSAKGPDGSWWWRLPDAGAATQHAHDPTPSSTTCTSCAPSTLPCTNRPDFTESREPAIAEEPPRHGQDEHDVQDAQEGHTTSVAMVRPCVKDN